MLANWAKTYGVASYILDGNEGADVYATKRQIAAIRQSTCPEILEQ
jgi:hypothetical protein